MGAPLGRQNARPGSKCHFHHALSEKITEWWNNNFGLQINNIAYNAYIYDLFEYPNPFFYRVLIELYGHSGLLSATNNQMNDACLIYFESDLKSYWFNILYPKCFFLFESDSIGKKNPVCVWKLHVGFPKARSQPLETFRAVFVFLIICRRSSSTRRLVVRRSRETFCSHKKCRQYHSLSYRCWEGLIRFGWEIRW